jgi:hypothetical protein
MRVIHERLEETIGLGKRRLNGVFITVTYNIFLMHYSRISVLFVLEERRANVDFNGHPAQCFMKCGTFLTTPSRLCCVDSQLNI